MFQRKRWLTAVGRSCLENTVMRVSIHCGTLCAAGLKPDSDTGKQKKKEKEKSIVLLFPQESPKGLQHRILSLWTITSGFSLFSTKVGNGEEERLFRCDSSVEYLAVKASRKFLTFPLLLGSALDLMVAGLLHLLSGAPRRKDLECRDIDPLHPDTFNLSSRGTSSYSENGGVQALLLENDISRTGALLTNIFQRKKKKQLTHQIKRRRIEMKHLLVHLLKLCSAPANNSPNCLHEFLESAWRREKHTHIFMSAFHFTVNVIWIFCGLSNYQGRLFHRLLEGQQFKLQSAQTFSKCCFILYSLFQFIVSSFIKWFIVVCSKFSQSWRTGQRISTSQRESRRIHRWESQTSTSAFMLI